MNRPIVLVVSGVLLGAVLALVLPGVFPGLVGGLVGSASADAGGWACYVVDRFPDTKDAADWRGAKSTAQGLNAVAASTPAGTVLSVQYPTAASGFATAQTDVGLICVKQ